MCLEWCFARQALEHDRSERPEIWIQERMCVNIINKSLISSLNEFNELTSFCIVLKRHYDFWRHILCENVKNKVGKINGWVSSLLVHAQGLSRSIVKHVPSASHTASLPYCHPEGISQIQNQQSSEWCAAALAEFYRNCERVEYSEASSPDARCP